MSTTRNYNTISPSARALLLMKAHTTIPFAKEAARLIQAPEEFEPDFNNRLPGFWIRVMHFEARYWSINQLLPEDATNILELSSGFSLRGLALATDRPVYYIDTDLPDLIATKQPLVDAIIKDQRGASGAAGPLRGHYELRPLNAVDTPAFNTIINSFPAGPLVIVNEGLLMYLGMEEKQRLCRQIREALLQRGGYWITADVYLNRDLPQDPELAQGDTLKEFLEQHNVKANMFESFEAAEAFFASEGLVIDREFEPDYMSLGSLPHFLASASPELLGRLRANMTGKMHTTWRLKPAT